MDKIRCALFCGRTCIRTLGFSLFLLFVSETNGQERSLDTALAEADSMLQAAVEEKLIPGAVLLVAQEGKVLFHKAYGYAQLYYYDRQRLDTPEPMTTDVLFDMASLTKVMATTFGVMLLVDRGLVDLDTPVSYYLPSFSGARKDSVTVRHLLTHTAGLYPWKPVYYHAATGEGALTYISRLPLAYAVGKERRYSDLGFMLLGYIIERVRGRPLDAFLQENLYDTLGLGTTGFNPMADGTTPVAATSFGNPYERRMVEDDDFGYLCDEDPDSFAGWRDYVLIGEVNDGNAYYAHNGVAGHAGLFSTASDVKVLIDVLLNEGKFGDQTVISPGVVRTFLSKDQFGNGLGWGMSQAVLGIADPPEGTFGHSGFTGTYALAVPKYGLSILLLTNRQNVGLNDSGYYPSLTSLRSQVVTSILQAIQIENE